MRMRGGILVQEKECTHIDQIKDVEPSSDGCDACRELGDTWVHLRMCLTCGHVGCCNSSKNKHATRHFLDTEHPIMKSYYPKADWMWCFVDEALVAQ